MRAAALVPPSVLLPRPALAARRLEGVDQPELLPPRAPGEPAKLAFDVGGWLTPRQVERIERVARKLESDTGVRLRVLAQNYPYTPGKAVAEYWNVDDDTVVLVADPGLGNALHFSVGQNVDLLVPRTFWRRLEGKFGTTSFWKEKGVDGAVEAAVASIDACLRDPEVGPLRCSRLEGDQDEPLAFI